MRFLKIKKFDYEQGIFYLANGELRRVPTDITGTAVLKPAKGKGYLFILLGYDERLYKWFPRIEDALIFSHNVRLALRAYKKTLRVYRRLNND